MSDIDIIILKGVAHTLHLFCEPAYGPFYTELHQSFYLKLDTKKLP